MAVQKNIKVQLSRVQDSAPSRLDVSLSAQSEINIQVADGWAITGHYLDQTLRTVTLTKLVELEAN